MAQGAQVLCVPAQFQHTTGRDHWHALLRARAIENQCFVVASGAMGSVRRSRRGPPVVRSFARRRPVGPSARRGARGRRRRLVRRSRPRRSARAATVVPGAAAPAAGRHLLMRRRLDGGYELDDDAGRVDVDVAHGFLTARVLGRGTHARDGRRVSSMPRRGSWRCYRGDAMVGLLPCRERRGDVCLPARRVRAARASRVRARRRARARGRGTRAACRSPVAACDPRRSRPVRALRVRPADPRRQMSRPGTRRP